MASVQERTTSTGKRTYAVLYRHGTRQRSKTFTTRKAATRFQTLIDQFGVDEALAMANQTTTPP